LDCSPGSRDFHPFQAVADAVNNAQSLRQFSIVLQGEAFPGDVSGLTALANSLREYKTLQEFYWFDVLSRFESAPVDLSPDLVLKSLSACPHLRIVTITTKCASAHAMKALLQLPKDTELYLFQANKEYWLAVADGIRQGQCNIKTLHFPLRNTGPQATEAVKAIASAIRLDRNLEHLTLRMTNDFNDEAGADLAEALTVNTTLRRLKLAGYRYVHHNATFSAPVYEAFSAMLRVNTSLRFEVPPFNDVVGDERLVDSRNQMRIEQGLN
jgi:hypothetical protein